MWFMQPEVWAPLILLTTLEIFLGVDNVMFISTISERLPESKRAAVHFLGTSLALFARTGLLYALVSFMALSRPMFVLSGQSISSREIVLIAGGMFLVLKSMEEIRRHVTETEERHSATIYTSMTAVLFQIVLFDLVFSIDSMVTALAMANDMKIMVAAMVLAALIMAAYSAQITSFVRRRPSATTIAICFLLVIGVASIAEGLEQPLPEAALFCLLAFSVLTEALNIRREQGLGIVVPAGRSPLRGKEESKKSGSRSAKKSARGTYRKALQPDECTTKALSDRGDWQVDTQQSVISNPALAQALVAAVSPVTMAAYAPDSVLKTDAQPFMGILTSLDGPCPECPPVRNDLAPFCRYCGRLVPIA